MRRIVSTIIAAIIILNTSLATYTSTVKADGFGIVVTSEKGKTVEITPKVEKIQGWKVESGDTTVTNNQFIMPEEDVVIKAILVNPLTIQMPDFTRIENRKEGESITIEATEEEEKEFTSWTATGITLTEGQTTSETITITMPGNAVTLVANYQNKIYTITYDANGGSGVPANQNKTYGQVIEISDTTPIREGYIFKGWSTSETATTAEYVAGNEYTANSNLVLYAVWHQLPATADVALGSYITYVPSKTESIVLGSDSGAILSDMTDYEYTSDEYEETSVVLSGNQYDKTPSKITVTTQKKLVNQIFNPSETTSWRVLYNNNGQLDIISAEGIGRLTLRGTIGYTRTVYTLNKLCEDYINPTYADSARNPGYVKGNRTEETADTTVITGSSLPIINTSTYPLQYTSRGFPYIDELYSTDQTQIKDTAQVLHSSGKIWLASRDFGINTSTVDFRARNLASDGSLSKNDLTCIFSGGTVTQYSAAQWIRPIVSLKSGIKITGGEGTLESPYTISID